MRCDCCGVELEDGATVAICVECFHALAVIKSKHALRCAVHKRRVPV